MDAGGAARAGVRGRRGPPRLAVAAAAASATDVTRARARARGWREWRAAGVAVALALVRRGIFFARATRARAGEVATSSRPIAPGMLPGPRTPRQPRAAAARARGAREEEGRPRALHEVVDLLVAQVGGGEKARGAARGEARGRRRGVRRRAAPAPPKKVAGWRAHHAPRSAWPRWARRGSGASGTQNGRPVPRGGLEERACRSHGSRARPPRRRPRRARGARAAALIEAPQRSYAPLPCRYP